MLPNLDPMIGGKVTKMEGVEVQVTSDCVGCGTCQQVCFVNAILIEDGRAHIGDGCRGCGRCVEACPNKAITITIPGVTAIDNTIKIKRIEEVVDVK